MKRWWTGTIAALLTVLPWACQGTSPEPRPADVSPPPAFHADPARPAVPEAETPEPAPAVPRTDALALLEKSAALDSPLKRRIDAWSESVERELAVQAAARRRGKQDLEALLSELEAREADRGLDPVGYYLKGRLLGKLDRLDEARAAFRRSVELDSEFLYGYEGQAKCAQDADGRPDLERVKQLTDRALRIWGEFPRGWLVLGQAHARHGNLDEALAAFAHVPPAHPAGPEAAASMAECHRLRNRPDLALATLRRALERHPDEPALEACMGFALLDEGKTEEARAAFRRVLAVDPESPDARIGLAAAKARSGDTAGAREDLTALSRDRELPRNCRRLALQMLSQLQADARPGLTGPQLLEILETSPDPARRREAASVLYRVPQKPVLMAFLRKLDVQKEPDEGVRVFAVKAIGMRALPEDLPMLFVRLLDPAREPSRLVRGAAARALEVVPLEKAPLAELVQALDDREDYVFGQARAALQRITGLRLEPDGGEPLSADRRARIASAWRDWLHERSEAAAQGKG